VEVGEVATTAVVEMYVCPSIIPLQVAQSKDPATELSLGEPMGVIPAGTLLKTEFSTVIPDATTQGKISVSVHVVVAPSSGSA